ncbi:hypothetical protein FOZ62_027904, partial [Perkinsus olseni]
CGQNHDVILDKFQKTLREVSQRVLDMEKSTEELKKMHATLQNSRERSEEDRKDERRWTVRHSMFKPSLYWLYYYLVALPRFAITIPLRPGLSTIDIPLIAPLTGIDSYYYSVAALDVIERWFLKVNMDPAFPFRVVPSHIDTRGINTNDVDLTARLTSTAGPVDGGTIYVIGSEGMETHGTQGIILDPGFIEKPCENREKNTLCAPRPSFDM